MSDLTALRAAILRYTPQNEQETADRAVMLEMLDQPDILTRDNRAAHFTASSWIVNPSCDRVLMAWHNIYRSWSWTGGHADGESDLLSVAVREALEETGLASVTPLSNDIFSLETLTVDGHEKRGAYVPSHLHLNVTYLLQADDSAPLRVKRDENSGVRWFAPGEALAACSEPWMVQRVYQKLTDRAAALLRAKG